MPSCQPSRSSPDQGKKSRALQLHFKGQAVQGSGMALLPFFSHIMTFYLFLPATRSELLTGTWQEVCDSFLRNRAQQMQSSWNAHLWILPSEPKSQGRGVLEHSRFKHTTGSFITYRKHPLLVGPFQGPSPQSLP